MKNIKTSYKLLILLVLIVVGGGALYIRAKNSSSFCYNFTDTMKYGDKEGQIGIPGLNGMQYFPFEVQLLQTALERAGFPVDPFEKTGGRVYMAQFFGPMTKSALVSFQKKYSLAQSGQVDTETTKQLNKLYACPTSKTSTSTAEVK